MKQDERAPLSLSKLKQKITDESKAAAVNALVPLLFVTLLAVGVTACVAHFLSAVPPLLRVVLVCFALPFWLGAAILGYRMGKAMKQYRKDTRQDSLRIVVDTVRDLTEEAELHHIGRMAYPDKAYVVYLENHGRCVIDSTLWNILKEGDEVYVAVAQRETSAVYRIYSTLTHRLIDD